MAQPFKYKPLPGHEWIRVLKIHPTERDSDRLICSLKPIRLGSATEERSEAKSEPFTALSYCWGSKPKSHIIECDGRSLPITENLIRALRQLQHCSDRGFWIDSICINQSDLRERSSQVQLFSRIYESASRVSVWLGDQDDSLPKDNIYRRKFDSSVTSRRHNAIPGAINKYDSVLQYLCHPWFTRAWIVQEVMLSNEVTILLDHQELQWEKFWVHVSTEIAECLGGTTEAPAFQPALRLHKLASSSKFIRILRRTSLSLWLDHDSDLARFATQEFCRILAFSSTLKASDPRDMIYALLGISEALGIEIPVPDYSKAVKLVFQEASITLMRKLSSMDQARLSNGQPRSTVAWRDEAKKRTRVHEEKMAYNLTTYSSVLRRGLNNWQHSPYPTLTISTNPKSYDVFEGDGAPNDVSEETNSALRGFTDFDEEVDVDSESEATYDPLFDELLRQHKELILHHILKHMKVNKLWGAAGNCNNGKATSHGGDSSNTASNAGHEGKDHEKRVMKPQDHSRGSCRKRNESEDEDGDEPEGRPRKQLKGRTSIDPRERLACPYFQRNSQGPKILSSCRGDGFETIARLKEHLYRVHHIFPCERCGYVFPKRQGLMEHLQSSQGCDAKDWRKTFDSAQGFDDCQQEELRSRKVQSWNQIFKILFPDDCESSYPPQYPSNTQLVHLLDNFRVHSLHEIERLVPQRLNNAPFLTMLPREHHDGIQSAISNLVKDIHNEILQSFRRDVLRAGPENRHEAFPIEENSPPTPSAAMLAYLHRVAPEDTLANQTFNPDSSEFNLDDFLDSNYNLRLSPGNDLARTLNLGTLDPGSPGATQHPLDQNVRIDSQGSAGSGRNGPGRVMNHADNHNGDSTAEDAWFMVE